MANDLETMRQRLRDVLFDTDDATWNAGEKDDILYMAVNRLSRRIPRPINPTDEGTDITLVSGAYTYDIPSTYMAVTKIMLFNSAGDQIGYLEGGWEVIGDLEAGFGDLNVSPRIVESYDGRHVSLSGYGRYTLNTLAEETRPRWRELHVHPVRARAAGAGVVTRGRVAQAPERPCAVPPVAERQPDPERQRQRDRADDLGRLTPSRRRVGPAAQVPDPGDREDLDDLDLRRRGQQTLGHVERHRVQRPDPDPV